MSYELLTAARSGQLDPLLVSQPYYNYPCADQPPPADSLNEFMPVDENLFPNDSSNGHVWSQNGLFNCADVSPVDFNLPMSPADSTHSALSSPRSEAASYDSEQQAPPQTHIAKTSKSTHRIPHSVVEQRYRHSVNSAIQSLRQSIPHLSSFDGEAGSRARPSKTTIIVSGVEYIKKLERQRDRLITENRKLREAVKQDHMFFN